MNGISVHCYIKQIVSDTSRLFETKRAGGSQFLECTYAMVFDLIEILYGFSLVDKQVGTCTYWTEGPDFFGMVIIPSLVINQ